MSWNKVKEFFGLKIQCPLEDDPDGFARAYGGKGACGR